MFVLLVELEAKPGCLERLEGLLQAMVEVASGEGGVLFYAVNRPQEGGNAFVLYELYRDRAAWEEHLRLRPIQEALELFETLLAAPPKITFCETVSTTAIGQARHPGRAPHGRRRLRAGPRCGTALQSAGSAA